MQEGTRYDEDVALIASDEVLGVVAAAERLLAATGHAVALCPTYREGRNQ